jgi:GNAT superfamily N-acetyltransferase
MPINTTKSVARKIQKPFEKKEYFIFLYNTELSNTKYQPPSDMEIKTETNIDDFKRSHNEMYLDRDKTLENSIALNLIERGCHLYTATNSKEIIGYLFMENKRREVANIAINLNNDEAFLFKGYTTKEFRGRGAYAQLLNHALTINKTTKKKIWVDCLSTNTSSIKGIVSAGFKHTETITGFFILGFNIWSKKRII